MQSVKSDRFSSGTSGGIELKRNRLFEVAKR